MHENRETSGASRSNQDRDRLAKAQSHNANMHAPEESDCAVVPMNQPNKEEQSSAEVGERRAQAKENIVESNTSPTQSGERVSQGLSGVRQTAKERRQERFTALLHHVSVGLLRDSFYALKRQAARSAVSNQKGPPTTSAVGGGPVVMTRTSTKRLRLPRHLLQPLFPRRRKCLRRRTFSTGPLPSKFRSRCHNVPTTKPRPLCLGLRTAWPHTPACPYRRVRRSIRRPRRQLPSPPG